MLTCFKYPIFRAVDGKAAWSPGLVLDMQFLTSQGGNGMSDDAQGPAAAVRIDPEGHLPPRSQEKRELLERLQFELKFLEDGGYGRSVRTPHKPTSVFQDSLTCLNFGDPLRTHPCGECLLMQYVPESSRDAEVPCHHIPLDSTGKTVATVDEKDTEEVLKQWLRHQISGLEAECGGGR